MIQLGPSFNKLSNRNESIFGYSGDRIGGIDLDIKLAMRKIMPSFGKNTLLNTGLPIPNSVFWNAIAVNDINAQSKFMLPRTGKEIDGYLSRAQEKQKVERLQSLHEGKLITRLSRSTELAKIHLSDRDPIKLPLGYIEPEFVIQISRQDLRESINEELEKFNLLMKEVEVESNVRPEVIYVTGGTANSPIVAESIRSRYGNVPVVMGDLFGSVTSGLITWANHIYQ